VEEEEDGNGTPYEDSSDEEDDSFVEDSDGELVRNNDGFPIYKDKGPKSVLRFGTKFADKRDFKEAIIKHALEQRKVINFLKDEGYRVRAKCDWNKCPWVCLLSTNSRTNSWLISTFTD
jgi:alpha-galactosidase